VALFTQPPVVTLYEIIVEPAETLVTSPVDGFTVATPVAELDQAPPVVGLTVKVFVSPVQS
jgi:hypothetical protein